MTNQANKASKTAMLGMAGCYAMGNFTDNFFKQAAILLAAAFSLTGLQSLATVLFALPFILFSAWAGWLADRVQKRNIVIGAKLLELAALSLGAFALWQAWWPGILAVVFIMAAQSTIFIPALNGAIPENFEPNHVPRVNSIIRTISTAAILAGMALAGPLLDLRPDAIPEVLPGVSGAEFGRMAAGAFSLVVSILGLALAFSIRRQKKTAGEKRKFPWAGPLDSVRHILEYRRDKPLFTVMTGDAFFYGLAPIVVISIANQAKQLGYSDTLSSLLSAALMVGIAVGALIAGRTTPESWRRLMVPALSFMAACLLLSSLTTLLPEAARLPWFGLTLLCAGIWGGIYIIPITSFMQIKPKSGEKGKVLAASNFYSFLSMALFGLAFGLISYLPTPVTFMVYGLAALAFAFLWAAPRLRSIEKDGLQADASCSLGRALQKLLSLRYSVKESGLAEVATASGGAGRRPILFLPNHPALIDPFIVYSRIAGFRPRALSDEKRMSGVMEKILVKKMRIITIPDAARDGRASVDSIRLGLDKICHALRDGDNVLLYPSGRIYRSEREEIGANSAVWRILREVPETRLVMLRTTGLWGSAFSRAGGKSPEFFATLFGKLPSLLASLVFFMPKRKVEIDFLELHELPKNKLELNRKLEDFYNQTARPALQVPYLAWQHKSVEGSKGELEELSPSLKG